MVDRRDRTSQRSSVFRVICVLRMGGYKEWSYSASMIISMKVIFETGWSVYETGVCQSRSHETSYSKNDRLFSKVSDSLITQLSPTQN
jgi:hypothetical protein